MAADRTFWHLHCSLLLVLSCYCHSGWSAHKTSEQLPPTWDTKIFDLKMFILTELPQIDLKIVWIIFNKRVQSFQYALNHFPKEIFLVELITSKETLHLKKNVLGEILDTGCNLLSQFVCAAWIALRCYSSQSQFIPKDYNHTLQVTEMPH